MNVNMLLTVDYEKKTLGERGKNKPKTNPIQTQTNPITEKQKMNVNKVLTKRYENKSHFWVKAKQTQFKPKTNPICSELAEPISKAKKISKKEEQMTRQKEKGEVCSKIEN